MSLQDVIERSPSLVSFMLDMEEQRERRRGELSRYFPDGLRWRYYKTKNGRGQRVDFCWSTTKNSAGKHLCWRVVYTGKGAKRRGKRDQWQAVSSSAIGNRLSRTRLREMEA